jgi:hypothetical protein
MKENKSHQDNSPWRAMGRVVVDSKGRVVAEAANEADAKLMAEAVRMRATLECLADTAALAGGTALDKALVHDFPSFWSDLRETLDDAGGWWPEGFGEVVA